MPTYDYKCHKCKKMKLDITQDSLEKGDHPCNCGGVYEMYFGNYKMQINGLETLTGETFDPGMNRWVPNSKRDEIGKAEGKLWMSHKEAEQEANRNKKINDDKSDMKFNKKVKKRLEEAVSKW